jgi:hypothetical protein
LYPDGGYDWDVLVLFAAVVPEARTPVIALRVFGAIVVPDKLTMLRTAMVIG